MKKVLPLLLAIGLAGPSVSQCLPNMISTNPASPVNNQLPSKTNLYFDWTQSGWMNNSSCQPSTLIESPFFKTDNLEILRQSKDMLPQDGWELIRRDFGYTDQNVQRPETPEHTYFILYNKYTGILRVLLKTCRGLDYNGAKITIKFDATSNFQTALLDYSSTVRVLDDQHVANPSAQSVSVFVNDKTKWFYADFPMTYDPCTCSYKSKINIVSQLIQNSQIQLQGSITGTITSIANGQGSVNNSGSYNFKDFVSDADQFKKGYASVDNFITETKNVVTTIPNSTNTINALTSFQNALKDNQFLKTGLAAVPWLKSAAGVLDFFIGGGKTSPQTVQLMPMAANLSLRVSGTMTTSNQYHNIIFSNPGSQDAQNDPENYPFYNEILGVFNLLNKPVLTTYRSFQPVPGTNGQMVNQVHSYKLKEALKWVLNPASDLVLQDGQIAYVIQSLNNSATPPPTFLFPAYNTQDPNVSQGFNTLEGKNAETGNWEYRTDYVDLNCLGNEHAFTFSRVVPYSWSVDPVQNGMYVKLLLNLKRVSNPSAQNVLLVVKIPVRYEYTTTPVGGALFNPANCSGGMVRQATSSEVSAFCSSTTYTNNRLMRIRSGEVVVSEPTLKGIQIKVGPNPATDIIRVSGSLKDKTINGIQLHDLAGRMQLQRKEMLSGDFTKEISCANLPSGTYVLKLVFTSGETKNVKIVVNR